MKSSTLDTVSMFLAELLGVGLILFFGCMGCLTYGKEPVHLQIALNFGLAVMTSVQLFAFISGAHFNPAVTLAAVIYRKMSIPMAGLYVAAQMIGGFMGFGLLKLLTPASLFNPNKSDSSIGLCTTMPHPELSDFQAVTIEFVATSVLILVCCAVWDHRNEKYHDSISIRFGLVIFVLACSAGPLTGASMNPARSFAPALWNGDFEKHWIYWLGPMAGGIIPTYLYRAVFWRPRMEEVSVVEEFAIKDINVRS